MGKERFNGQMAENFKGSFKRELCMVMASTFGKTEGSTKATTKKTKSMVKAPTHIQMDKNIQETGKKGCSTELEE